MLPKRNQRDLEEVPEDAREQLDVRLAGDGRRRRGNGDRRSLAPEPGAAVQRPQVWRRSDGPASPDAIGEKFLRQPLRPPI